MFVCLYISGCFWNEVLHHFTSWRSKYFSLSRVQKILLLDFSLTVKAATLIFMYVCVLAISSAKEGKSGFIYNLVKSL